MVPLSSLSGSQQGLFPKMTLWYIICQSTMNETVCNVLSLRLTQVRSLTQTVARLQLLGPVLISISPGAFFGDCCSAMGVLRSFTQYSTMLKLHTLLLGTLP